MFWRQIGLIRVLKCYYFAVNYWSGLTVRGLASSPSKCPSPPLEWVSLEGSFIEFYKKEIREKELLVTQVEFQL